MTEPTTTESPADIAYGKMIDAALDLAVCLTDFYSHMEDVRRNMLAGTPLPEIDAINAAGAVHEAHDKYFEAACEFDDAPCVCADCRAEAEKAAAAPVTASMPAVPTGGRKLQ